MTDINEEHRERAATQLEKIASEIRSSGQNWVKQVHLVDYSDPNGKGRLFQMTIVGQDYKGDAFEFSFEPQQER